MLVRRILILLTIFLGVLPVYAADNFWISGGSLMRGTRAFHVRAIHVPTLASSTGQLGEMVPAFTRLGRAGADAAWYDVPGLNAEGSAMDPAAVAALATIAERAKDTRLAIVLRVPGAGGDEAWRERATETVARALRDQDLVLYWFDGADAAGLAKRFKKLAPKLTVIAPKNGDVQALDADPEKPSPASLVVDAIPADPWGDTHFLLRGSGDETYAALDAAMMSEVEKQGYTPDNSLLSADERAEGFQSLFNGRDLSGWWFYGDDKEGFRVTPQGTIAWVREGGGGLISYKRFKDFVFRFEFKLFKEGDNSGTYIRAPRAGRQSKLGMEFQMMGDAGKVPDEHVTGAVYDVLPPRVNAAKPAGEWNTVEIDFRGGHLKATLNGQVVQDVNFDDMEELKYRNREGFIGLQDHNCPVEWRNLRIKEL